MGGEDGHRLATWLVRERRAIERALATSGKPVPDPRSAEAEALRRFRCFVTNALRVGERATPALEGLRASARRTGPLIDAWIDAAASTAGPDGPRVRAALAPLAERFRLALRGTAGARRASGAARPSQRRAVSAAIDRVADAFLAVDTDSGLIADANPAAGALLATTRDALLGADAMGFVPEPDRDGWWTQIDAMAEGAEPRRFHAALRDAHGAPVPVEASVSRFATRRRTLALFVARPRAGSVSAPSHVFHPHGERC